MRQLFAELRSEAQELAVAVVRGDELQSAIRRGKNHGGQSREADRKSEAQDMLARLALILGGIEEAHRRRRREQEIEAAKKLVHLAAKALMALAQRVDLRFANRGAKLQPGRYGRLKVVKETSVQLCRFKRLDGHVDVPCLGPERGIKRGDLCFLAKQAVSPSFERTLNRRVAVFKQGAGKDAHSKRGRGGRVLVNWGWQIEDGFGQQRRVSQISEEPADGVEGASQVCAAAPVADSVGAAISRQPAERTRNANGAASIASDGGERGAFLDGGSGPAGGSAGEAAWVGGLQAVAVVAVLSSNPIGELMQMSFAGDDGSRAFQPSSESGVLCCRWVVGRIKFGAAAGLEALEIKEILSETGTPKSGGGASAAEQRLTCRWASSMLHAGSSVM